MKYQYLSDDELEQLIASTEGTGMLQAPKRIQTAVWEKVAEKETPVPVSRTAAGKRLQLAVYSLKVGLAAAAAIFMLFRLDGLQESEWLWHVPEVNESQETEDRSGKEQDREDFLHTKWIEVSEWFGTILESDADRS